MGPKCRDDGCACHEHGIAVVIGDGDAWRHDVHEWMYDWTTLSWFPMHVCMHLHGHPRSESVVVLALHCVLE